MGMHGKFTLAAWRVRRFIKGEIRGMCRVNIWVKAGRGLNQGGNAGDK